MDYVAAGDKIFGSLAHCHNHNPVHSGIHTNKIVNRCRFIIECDLDYALNIEWLNEPTALWLIWIIWSSKSSDYRDFSTNTNS